MNNNFSFISTRRFAPLFITQFLGALNDNLLKIAIIVLITYHHLGEGTLDAEQLLNISALVFILPFFLFSATSGRISTKFNKAKIARWVKISELIIMLIAAIGFFSHSIVILLSTLFLMGTHSTFFGPVKYAILPEYLKSNELVAGNGIIEMGTFLAILFGQMLGTSMASSGAPLMVTITLVIAFLGWLSSQFMPNVAPQNPDTKIELNIIYSTMDILKQSFADKNIRAAIFGISWFWLLGAVYITQLSVYTSKYLGGDENVFNLMLALFSVGIGLGSICCAKLSKGKLELGLIILGAVGMSIFGVGVSIYSIYTLSVHEGALIGFTAFMANSSHYIIMLSFALLGFFSGFFSVPLYTWLQTASTEAFRANAIAANNIVNGLFMVIAALGSTLILLICHNVSVLYLTVSVVNLLALFFLCKLAPQIWQARFTWLKRKA